MLKTKNDFIEVKHADGESIFSPDLYGYAAQDAAKVLAQNWWDTAANQLYEPHELHPMVQGDVERTINVLCDWAKVVDPEFVNPIPEGQHLVKGATHLVAQVVVCGKNPQRSMTAVYGPEGDLIKLFDEYPGLGRLERFFGIEVSKIKFVMEITELTWETMLTESSAPVRID